MRFHLFLDNIKSVPVYLLKLNGHLDVVTYRYCTEASNQKSKYAYRKIFFYKKSTGTYIAKII